MTNACLRVWLADALLSHFWSLGGGCLHVEQNGATHFLGGKLYSCQADQLEMTLVIINSVFGVVQQLVICCWCIGASAYNGVIHFVPKLMTR